VYMHMCVCVEGSCWPSWTLV